jgi:hypothetical protein
MSNVTITPATIFECAAARPSKDGKPGGWLDIDYKRQRQSKNGKTKYQSVELLLPDGSKQKLSLAFKNVALAGGIKPKDEREYPQIKLLYRESSGGDSKFGAALIMIYDELERIIQHGKDTGLIKVKASQSMFRNIVQKTLDSGEELKDPMIRVHLPIRDNKAGFKTIKIEKVNGKPKQVAVKVDEDNVHEVFRSRTITAGHLNMDSLVYSGQGISVPCKVTVIVVKPAASIAPAVSDLLSQDELLAMACDDADEAGEAAEPVPDNDDNDDDEDTSEVDPSAEPTDAQMAALKALNI